MLIESAIAYGKDVINKLFDSLLDSSERPTQVRLRQIPDGAYGTHNSLDNEEVER
jgi:hypothetical protein